MSVKTALRESALRKLADAYGIDPTLNYNSGEEDLGEILEDEEYKAWDECYAAVTASGEFNYIKVFPDIGAAKRHAGANIDNDIYAESPVEIVNLDTGHRLRPRIDWY